MPYLCRTYVGAVSKLCRYRAGNMSNVSTSCRNRRKCVEIAPKSCSNYVELVLNLCRTCAGLVPGMCRLWKSCRLCEDIVSNPCLKSVEIVASVCRTCVGHVPNMWRMRRMRVGVVSKAVELESNVCRCVVVCVEVVPKSCQMCIEGASHLCRTLCETWW